MGKIAKKVYRLLFYSIKGNFSYAFKQFKITNAIYYFALHIKYAKSNLNSSKAAVFDLKDGSLGRYIYTLINIFRVNDYSIFLIPDSAFYSTSTGLYLIEIYRFLHIDILYTKKQLDKFTIRLLVTDNHQTRKIKTEFDKTVIVEVDDLKLAQKKNVVPFSFHPLIYKKNYLTNCRELEEFISSSTKKKRNVRVFFGGQTYHESYYKLEESFPELFNRNKFFSSIFGSFEADIAQKWDLGHILDKTKKQIVILDRKENNIKPENWFNYLGNSDFFLCPPGFEMPMCHNVIEAMACGTIPIIQYSKYFTPHLVNGVNCLVFSTENELVGVIKEALGMSTSRIDELRKNVFLFYSKYLSPKSFTRGIEESKNSIIRASLIAGSHSIKKKDNHF